MYLTLFPTTSLKLGNRAPCDHLQGQMTAAKNVMPSKAAEGSFEKHIESIPRIVLEIRHRMGLD